MSRAWSSRRPRRSRAWRRSRWGGDFRASRLTSPHHHVLGAARGSQARRPVDDPEGKIERPFPFLVFTFQAETSRKTLKVPAAWLPRRLSLQFPYGKCVECPHLPFGLQPAQEQRVTDCQNHIRGHRGLDGPGEGLHDPVRQDLAQAPAAHCSRWRGPGPCHGRATISCRRRRGQASRLFPSSRLSRRASRRSTRAGLRWPCATCTGPSGIECSPITTERRPPRPPWPRLPRLRSGRQTRRRARGGDRVIRLGRFCGRERRVGAAAKPM